MKILFRIISASFVFPVLLILSIKAQTQSILYLKNGSVIKCNLVRIIPDSILIIQTADSIQLVYPYTQIDSLIYSSKGSTPIPLSEKSSKSKKSQSFGFFLGYSIPLGEDNSVDNRGMALGFQIGNGSNPGFIAQFNCNSYGPPGSHNVSLSLLIGPRFGTDQPKPGTGIFFSPLMGLLSREQLQLVIGISVDVYVITKLFVGTRFAASVINLSSSSYSTSYISFVVGYGIN